jgi:hypothetical protein
MTKHSTLVLTTFTALLLACSRSPTQQSAPATPMQQLTGTWAFSSGQIISGSVYGTLSFNSESDTVVLRSDSTYVCMVKRSASINGNYFGGIGSGTWSATATNISFGYPLSQGFEYTLDGNGLTLTNRELTLHSSRVH